MTNQPPQDPQWVSPVVEKRERKDLPQASWFTVLGIAGQIGYIIAIPAVLFVLGGAWLDTHFGTSPLFVLLGIPLALTISALSVWKMIKQVQKK